VTRSPSGWLLLAFLVGAAAIAVVVGEAGGSPALAYRGLAAIFLVSTAAFTLTVFLWRPESVNLWILFLFFSVLFLAADGIVRVGALGEGALWGDRFRFGTEALLLLAIGLVATRAAYDLVVPKAVASAAKRSICARAWTVRPSLVVALVTMIWALRAYAATQGLVISHSRDVMVSVEGWTSLLIQLGALARPLLFFLGATLLFDHRRSRRVLGVVVIAGELVAAAVGARRLLLEVIVVVCLVYIWTGRRPKVVQLVTLAGTAALVGLVIWPFMFQLRSAADATRLYWAEPSDRFQILVIDTIPHALANFRLMGALEAEDKYVGNIRDRASTIQFLIEVVAAQREGREAMGGRVITAALVASVPRLLWPGKQRLLDTETWQVEELIQTHFGLPLIDTGSTVLSQGYADLGVAGVLLYGALLGAFLGVCERALAGSRCAILGLWIYGLGALLAVQIEANVTDIVVIGRAVVPLLLLDRLAGGTLDGWLTSRPSSDAVDLRLRAA
jgi:hypothetical protein